jgi:hypothetical protein
MRVAIGSFSIETTFSKQKNRVWAYEDGTSSWLGHGRDARLAIRLSRPCVSLANNPTNQDSTSSGLELQHVAQRVAGDAGV